MNQHADDVSAAMEHAFSDVDLNTPVEQVIGRGRRLRTRRRAATGGILAAVAAVALAVPLAHSAARGPSTMTQTAAAASATGRTVGVQMDLAGFSVHTKPNGVVEVTPHQLFDPAAMVKVLGKAGIPATVEVTQAPPSFLCIGGTPAVTKLLRGIVEVVVPGHEGKTLIRPSLMPHGAKLDFSYIFTPKVNGKYPIVSVGMRNVPGAPLCHPGVNPHAR